MPTTIPITLNLAISLPDGLELSPQILAQPDAWQFTAAVAECDPPGIDVQLPEQESPPPATDAGTPSENSQLAMLQATIARQQNELVELRAALERLMVALQQARAAQRGSAATIDMIAARSATTAHDAKHCTDPPQTDPDEDSHGADGADADGAASDDIAAGETTLDGQFVPPRQRVAAALLASGASLTAAGEAAGVSRKTIHSWRRDNPAFVALFHSYCNEIRESAEARLNSLAHQSTSIIAAKLNEGDSRVAFQLAKGLGLLTGKPRELLCERADQLAPCHNDILVDLEEESAEVDEPSCEPAAAA